MRRLSHLAAVVPIALTLCAAPARAQTTNFAPMTSGDGTSRAVGWTIVPGIGYAISWDDNVLIRGNGDDQVGAYVSGLNPRVTADYAGRRTQLTVDYDGTFLMYRDLSALNSYDQRGSVSLRETLTRHASWFVRGSAARVPTTELVAFVGVPFVRTGSSILDGHTGVDVTFTRRDSLTASFDLQRLDFDDAPGVALSLQGGHGAGTTLGWRHALTTTTDLTVDYDYQHAIVAGQQGTFDIQNGWVGGSTKLGRAVQVYGAVGVARVTVSGTGEPRTGPAWRGGVTRQQRRATFDLSATRSFVPSYGYGGTVQNEDVTGRARVTVTRRIAAQSSVSWRSNESLLPGEPNLHSLWIEASVGYTPERWVRIEGFFVRSRQTIDRPGGLLDRNRVGVQIVTSAPIRVR